MRAIATGARSLVVTLALLAGCTRQVELKRADWPVVQANEHIFVQTTGGSSYELTGFRFMTESLVAWKGEQVTPSEAALTDTLRIPLGDIAVVRVRKLDRAKTALIASGIVIGGMILIAQGTSNDRPEAVPRPDPVPSCPYIYSFDGRGYIFDSETYAGAVARGLERTDVDNLDHLRPVNGKYRMLLTDERNEVQYTDAVSLLVAEHLPGTRAFPDAAGAPLTVGAGVKPLSWRRIGGDTLPARAGWEATFIRPPGDSAAVVMTLRNTNLAPFVLEHLLTLMGREVYTWYASLANDAGGRERTRAWIMAEGALALSLETGTTWTTVARLPDVGPLIAKQHVAVLGLSRVVGDTVRVRFESSPGLWEDPIVELASYHGAPAIHELRPSKAVTAEGRDVREILAIADGRYHVATRGSRVEIEFEVPSAAAGRVLTPLVRTTGHYYIDADDRGTARPEIVGRIMSDRGFAQTYFDARWREATGTSIRR